MKDILLNDLTKFLIRRGRDSSCSGSSLIKSNSRSLLSGRKTLSQIEKKKIVLDIASSYK